MRSSRPSLVHGGGRRLRLIHLQKKVVHYSVPSFPIRCVYHYSHAYPSHSMCEPVGCKMEATVEDITTCFECLSEGDPARETSVPPVSSLLRFLLFPASPTFFSFVNLNLSFTSSPRTCCQSRIFAFLVDIPWPFSSFRHKIGPAQTKRTEIRTHSHTPSHLSSRRPGLHWPLCRRPRPRPGATAYKTCFRERASKSVNIEARFSLARPRRPRPISFAAGPFQRFTNTPSTLVSR